MPSRVIALLLSIFSMCCAAGAQEPDDLQALRKDLLDAFAREDIDGILAHCTPNVVMTWQSGEVARGHAGVRDYFLKMMTGSAPLVRSYEIEIAGEPPAERYGAESAVVTGTSTDHLELSNGMKLDFDDRWTAVAVVQDGKWRIAALHVSTNVFDNPIHSEMIDKIYWIAGFAMLAGVFLGFMIGRALKKPARNDYASRPAASGPTG